MTYRLNLTYGRFSDDTLTQGVGIAINAHTQLSVVTDRPRERSQEWLIKFLVCA